jgi:hypothetical protein
VVQHGRHVQAASFLIRCGNVGRGEASAIRRGFSGVCQTELRSRQAYPQSILAPAPRGCDPPSHTFYMPPARL